VWYAVFTEDHEDTLDKRMTARPDHVARLKALCDEGRLLVAGPHPAVDSPDPGGAGFTGSLLIVDFPSLDEVQAWADDDPYVTAGVIRKFSVKPFNRVLP
jgi:uncharacterized protein YciI